MQEFVIAPPGARPLWVLIPLSIVLLVVVGGLAVSLVGSRTTHFDITASDLRIRGDWYARTIPLEALRTAEARRVDFDADPDLRPRWRTWGTGLPGYQAGWFRLANNTKALVYLTDRSRAVYIPTAEGYDLLLSPAEPEAFLVALKKLNAGS